MSKLKIHLQKLERGIIFQILEQEGFRAIYNLDGIDHNNRKILKLMHSINGIRLCFNSISLPQITLNSTVYKMNGTSPRFIDDVRKIDIYLRGSNKNGDDNIIVIKFKDNKLRDKVYETLKIGFSELIRK